MHPLPLLLYSHSEFDNIKQAVKKHKSIPLHLYTPTAALTFTPAVPFGVSGVSGVSGV